MRHKVQLSQETADLLVSAGKESWVRPRKDLVEAKGKGRLQTVSVGHCVSSIACIVLIIS